MISGVIPHWSNSSIVIARSEATKQSQLFPQEHFWIASRSRHRAALRADPLARNDE
jgi:hypothetical protein